MLTQKPQRHLNPAQGECSVDERCLPPRQRGHGLHLPVSPLLSRVDLVTEDNEGIIDVPLRGRPVSAFKTIPLHDQSCS